MRVPGVLIACLCALWGTCVIGTPEPASAEDADARKAVAEIQPEINAAIDRGVLRLLKLQQRDGSWGEREKQYGGGMTALALYAAIRSGVPLEHPAVRKGLARLATWDPVPTYSIACELMALEATHDKRYHARMQVLLERLLSHQRDGWGYPYGHSSDGWNDRRGRNDLSNTHFAALGLRAARLAGLEVPPRAYVKLIKETRFHQLRPKNDVAGFAYVGPSTVGGIGKPTGSMTCAGITILKICRDGLADGLKPKDAAQLDTSIAQALAWLEANWKVDGNPNNKDTWKYYYLYGLERVGSLLGTERIGSHLWYLEGAKEFLKTQKEDGGWGGEPQTAYALLFLLRATSTSTGSAPIPSVLGSYETEGESPVRIRASGHSPLSIWITSMEADALAGRKIERVSWLVDDEAVATVRLDPPRTWANDTFRVLHHFGFTGDFQIKARVHLAASKTQEAGVVESAPLPVKVQVLWPPWGLREAAWAQRNRLPREGVFATASSWNNDNQVASNAVDGTTDRFWVCKGDDARPTLGLKLRRGVKANAVVLHPVAGHELQRGTFDQPRRIEIRVNGKRDVHVLHADPDDLRPYVLRLPKPIRIKKLEIAIVDRLPGRSWTGQAGFAEVSLELDPVLPPTWARNAEGLVALECDTPDAVIHYTVGGTTPTGASSRFEAPFPLPDGGRLHAVAHTEAGRSRLLVADVPAESPYRRLDRRRWRIRHTDSEEKRGNAGLAIDGDPSTHWHTRFTPKADPYPHEIQIDLGESVALVGITYRARRIGTNGNVKDWTVYVSDDPEVWGPPAAAGTFESARSIQRALFEKPASGRYLRFVARSEHAGQAFASCAELDVLVK